MFFSAEPCGVNVELLNRFHCLDVSCTLATSPCDNNKWDLVLTVFINFKITIYITTLNELIRVRLLPSAELIILLDSAYKNTISLLGN